MKLLASMAVLAALPLLTAAERAPLLAKPVSVRREVGPGTDALATKPQWRQPVKLNDFGTRIEDICSARVPRTRGGLAPDT